MNILVTGLCISRNLGGPAMALTLVEQLKKRLQDINFVFAVSPVAYQQENLWANYYGVKIVRLDTFISYFLNTNPLFKTARYVYSAIGRKTLEIEGKNKFNEIHNEFMDAFKNCDAVINMMGISYVGDGLRGFSHGPSSYSNLYYAEKHKKPFTHFIQSFGPFDDKIVRFFAKRDFEKVSFIPARGKICAKYCKAIVSNPKKVLDFPDCAILLPLADEKWTLNYLMKLGLSEKNYIVLSPSSVIYNFREKYGKSVGENHVKSFLIIAKSLLLKGETLLFLPHMYSDNKRECDREICRAVLNSLKKNKNNDFLRYKLIVDDLDVWQAKSLIAKAKAAIVSRYHALVAATSSGVPVIAIGWNIKYDDLLEYYGIQNMAFDARKYTPESLSEEVLNKIKEYKLNDYSEILLKKQNENVTKVDYAFDLLSNWLKNNIFQKERTYHIFP